MVKKDGIVVRAQNVMTIRHLLSMRSGLSYNKTTPSVARVMQKPHTTTREFADDDYSVKPYEPAPPISDVHIGGGSGLYASNDQYMKLPRGLANGGLAPNGYRVLSPETIDLIKMNHMQPLEQKNFSKIKPGYGYGLGVRTLVDRNAALGQSPVGEFGWDGMAASYSLVDTYNKIAIVWTTHVVNCRPAYREIHPHIRNLVYDALGTER